MSNDDGNVSRQANWKWTDERRGDLHVVRRRNASGAMIEWTINAAKGWNAERVAYVMPDGRVTHEAVATLHKYGDRWFPQRTQYFENGALIETVSVSKAEFDAETHPKRFTPADISAEVGYNIMPNDYPSDGQGFIWDGKAAVAVDAYMNRVRAGDVTPGPTIRAKIANGPGSPYWTEEERLERAARRALWNGDISRPNPLHETEWRRYVREFTRRYVLDESQRGAAFAILEDCENRARQLLMASPVAASQSIGSPASRPAGSMHSGGEHNSNHARLLQEVFETNLKPRLDSLLTTAQRKL